MTSKQSPERASSGYLEQEIRSEDPIARIARIFEMACAHLTRARAGIAAGDMALKGRSVERVSRCISLLQCSLDKERGGEFAANLDRLYTYLQNRVTEGHVHNRDEAFAEVLQHMGEIGGAWRVASRRPRHAQPAAAEAGAAPAEAVASR